jgi:hypothetical protein
MDSQLKGIIFVSGVKKDRQSLFQQVLTELLTRMAFSSITNVKDGSSHVNEAESRV